MIRGTFDAEAETVDGQTAILRQQEKERLAEREKRKVGQVRFANLFLVHKLVLCENKTILFFLFYIFI